MVVVIQNSHVGAINRFDFAKMRLYKEPDTAELH